MTSGRLTPHTVIRKLVIELAVLRPATPLKFKQKQVGADATPPEACWPESPGEPVNEAASDG
jgi:hypothetical protein